MARSILDIVIKLSKQGGADQEAIKGLVQLKSSIMDAAAVAGTLVAAGYGIKTVFDATVGTMVNYADQVRAIQQASGATAEESSKLIQITDDYKISQEALLKVMQKNGKEYDFTINGLAKMSDQYLSLGSAQERAAFMQDRFGKNWTQFVELMQQGSAKIKASADGINQALILDQRALDSAREYEKQLDQLSDSWMAFKVAAGSAALPGVVDVLQKVNAEITEENGQLIQGEKGWRMFLGPIGAVWNAVDLFSNANDRSVESLQNADAARYQGLASLYSMRDAMNEFGATAETNYGQVITDLEKLNRAQDDYASKVKEVNSDASLSDDERIAKLNALGAQYQNTTAQIVASNMLQIMSQDGITQAEFARYAAFMEGTGLMTAGAAQQAIALNSLATSAANGTMSVQQLKAAIAALSNKTVTITVNTVGNLYAAYGDAARVQGSGAKRAAGSNGWESVPAGYGLDSYPVMVNSSEQYMVKPKGSRAGGGGASVNISVNVNSMVNTADQEQMKSALMPAITSAVRSLQAQGMMQ